MGKSLIVLIFVVALAAIHQCNANPVADQLTETSQPAKKQNDALFRQKRGYYYDSDEYDDDEEEEVEDDDEEEEEAEDDDDEVTPTTPEPETEEEEEEEEEDPSYCRYCSKLHKISKSHSKSGKYYKPEKSSCSCQEKKYKHLYKSKPVSNSYQEKKSKKYHHGKPKKYYKKKSDCTTEPTTVATTEATTESTTEELETTPYPSRSYHYGKGPKKDVHIHVYDTYHPSYRRHL